jgi:septin family protein
MPGPPLNSDSENFQPILLFVYGSSNLGKTTFANTLSSSRVAWINLDSWCTKFFQTEESKYNLGKLFHRINSKKKLELYSSFIPRVNELKKNNSYKVYVFEGFILKDEKLINSLCDQFETPYSWVSTRHSKSIFDCILSVLT